MAELGEEVEIERGVAATLPSNSRKRRTLPPPWVEAKDRFPPDSADHGLWGSASGQFEPLPLSTLRDRCQIT